jgi:hypothetical protein
MTKIAPTFSPRAAETPIAITISALHPARSFAPAPEASKITPTITPRAAEVFAVVITLPPEVATRTEVSIAPVSTVVTAAMVAKLAAKIARRTLILRSMPRCRWWWRRSFGAGWFLCDGCACAGERCREEESDGSAKHVSIRS